MNYIAKSLGREFIINLIEKSKGQFEAQINGESLLLKLSEIDGSNLYSILVGNKSYEMEIRRNETGIVLHYRGESFECFVEDERTARLKNAMRKLSSPNLAKEILAPMPGLIVAIEVVPGQAIKKGDGLMIIEAMKMENEISAAFEATIKEIKVKEKQAVDKNQVLILLE
jgi:biotin carboxyl carrier protein